MNLKIVLRSSIGLFLMFFLFSCTSNYGNYRIQNETSESISKKIFVGKSTKADILKEYGVPSSKGTSSEGDETWGYFFAAVTRGPYFANTKEKKLSIIFNSSGIVKNFSINDSKI